MSIRLLLSAVRAGGATELSSIQSIGAIIMLGQPTGYPAGGNGGRGGDIVIKVGGNTNDLHQIPDVVRAENGGRGLGRLTHGKSGSSVTLFVPQDTAVFKLVNVDGPSSTTTPSTRQELPSFPDRSTTGPTGTTEIMESSRLIYFHNGKAVCSAVPKPLCVLRSVGDHLVVAAGGSGGLGNTKEFPHSRTPGAKGDIQFIKLELQHIADIAFIGCPNAGKSSLLAALTGAHSRIAEYPFTTHRPHLGCINYSDGFKVTVADLPALVKGAVCNKVHGHQCLGHTQRVTAHAYVLDMSQHMAPAPLDAFYLLRREVVTFSPFHKNTPFMVICNKCDQSPQTSLPRVDDLWKSIQAQFPGTPVIAVSARYGDGIQRVVECIRSLLDNSKAVLTVPRS